MLGAGAVASDRLLLSISTGGQLVQPVDAVRVDPQGRIHTFCTALAPAAGQAGWYQMGATLNAGMALRWLRDNVLGFRYPDAYDVMNIAAENSPPGAEGLLFLPYLVGERSPHMDPAARGAFFGLTLRHGQGDLVRAVMEGATFACYDAYGVLAELGVEAQSIILAGGGAKSPLWRQIVADIFGLPVQPLLTGEQSALGAVLLAGGGAGMFDLVATARDWAQLGPLTAPDGARHAFYVDRFAAFRSLYLRNKGHFV
jgi:xylulokinase